MKLFYLGPEGTFSHEAAMAFCDLYGFPRSALVPVSSVPRVVAQVVEGQDPQALGCVPIENSIEGSVTASWDAMGAVMQRERSATGGDWLEEPCREERHQILATGRMPIVQNLLTAVQVPSLAVISDVYSHSQALAQCRGWIQENLPQARIHSVDSTALAAERIRTAGGIGEAAIASRAAARHYGLHLQVTGIEDHGHNVTRFALFGKGKHRPAALPEAGGQPQLLSVLLTGVANGPGGLYATLEPFARFQLNLRRIESRPVGTDLGTYVFYLDVEWNHEPEAAKEGSCPTSTPVASKRTWEKLKWQLTQKGVQVTPLGLYSERDLPAQTTP